MGFDEEPLRDVRALEAVELHPGVELEMPSNGSRILAIRLTNRGGGIGRVAVTLNGEEVAPDVRGARPSPDVESLDLELDLAGLPELRAGRENTIGVEAFNAEGSLRSRRFEVSYSPPGAPPASGD